MVSHFLLLLSLTSFHVQAQEISTKIATPKAMPQGQDVDQIITNNKMRAESGSKSKYSIATSFGYSGGSLETPLSERRPNLSGATGSTDIAALTGSVSGKYALTSQTGLFAGFGVRWLTPLQGVGLPDGYNGNKVDADNPYINYQYLYRWAGVQSVLILNESFYTNVNLVRAGYVTGFSISQNNMYDIGRSGLTVGFNVYANLGLFNDNSLEAERNQSDYALGVVPAVEYRLSERWNLRTDTNLASFQHVRSESQANAYQQQHWAQTLSVGYALLRDVYVSPGLQWLPEDMRWSRTTTWLNANLNLF